MQFANPVEPVKFLFVQYQEEFNGADVLRSRVWPQMSVIITNVYLVCSTVIKLSLLYLTLINFPIYIWLNFVCDQGCLRLNSSCAD